MKLILPSRLLTPLSHLTLQMRTHTYYRVDVYTFVVALIIAGLFTLLCISILIITLLPYAMILTGIQIIHQ